MIINKEQNRKLVKLLLELRDNPYYQKKLCDLSEENIINNAREIYDLLEVSTKSSLLNNLETILSKYITNNENVEEVITDILDVDKLSENHDRVVDIHGKKWYIEMTSGTSGKPFPIIKSGHERYIEAAYLLKCRKRIYSETSFANSFMMIHPIDEILKNISHRGYKSENFDKLLSYMEEKKPKWIFTGVNLLVFLGTYIISTNQVARIQKIGIKFIEVTSQKMEIGEKRKYENIFGARIVNNYGCREVWNIAYECKCGKMHINTDYLIVDVVDQYGESLDQEGEAGNVVLTSLTNTDMPLVKYAIGDRARIFKSKCRCGCLNPIIVLEESRKEELIEGTERNGTMVFRKILRRLYFHDGIRDLDAVKIVQDDVWHFTIYLKKKDTLDKNYFEKIFTEQAAKNIENIEQYKFNFRYEYPFKDKNYMESEKIFRNSIKHNVSK